MHPLEDLPTKLLAKRGGGVHYVQPPGSRISWFSSTQSSRINIVKHSVRNVEAEKGKRDPLRRRNQPKSKKATAGKTSGRRSIDQSGNPNRSFPIVGIGASAGGFQAFTELLNHLPVDTGL